MNSPQQDVHLTPSPCELSVPQEKHQAHVEGGGEEGGEEEGRRQEWCVPTSHSPAARPAAGRASRPAPHLAGRPSVSPGPGGLRQTETDITVGQIASVDGLINRHCNQMGFIRRKALTPS